MGKVKAKKAQVTGPDLHHDGEKEKALKKGYITIYTTLFAVRGPVSTGYTYFKGGW